MSLFDQFPYTNFHELNLNWILKMLKELSNKLENFIALNTIKYADPIQWNITRQYEANTVVIDGNTGTAYLSTKPVPSGVTLTNTDYWTVIFTLDLLSANDNITFRDDGANIIATFTSAENDWLMWNEKLYKVIRPIAINEAYVPGYNIDRYSVELFIKEYLDAINDRIDELISSKYYITPEEFGAVGDGSTDDSQAINDALSDGRPVMFTSEKTYKCDSYLSIPDNAHLYGNGCTILFDGSATRTSTDDYMLADTTNNVIIDGFIFDIEATSTLAYALSVFTSKDFIISNCTFKNFYGTCIRVNADENFVIDSCEFYNITGAYGNPGECMFGQSWKNAIVNNCKCNTIDDHFIYMNNQSENVKVINCIAEKCGQTTLPQLGAAFQIYASSRNITFENCSDIDCSKGAFRVAPYGVAGETAPTKITIKGHTSKNCSTNWFSIISNLVDPFSKLIITNCTIEGYNSEAIRLNKYEDIIISNNIFIRGNNSIGIYATACEGLLIENNIFMGGNSEGIRIGSSGSGTNCIFVSIKNNYFKDVTTRGINSLGAGNDIRLCGNIITGGISLFSGTVKCLGNAIYDSYEHSISFGLNSDSVAHFKGDIIFNRNPATGQPVGWICTDGDGTGVGTLKAFGTIS